MKWLLMNRTTYEVTELDNKYMIKAFVSSDGEFHLLDLNWLNSEQCKNLLTEERINQIKEVLESGGSKNLFYYLEKDYFVFDSISIKKQKSKWYQFIAKRFINESEEK